VDILREEDPEVLLSLPDVKALVPGHRVVLKRAYVDLRYILFECIILVILSLPIWVGS
jgi:hypothetical protein